MSVLGVRAGSVGRGLPGHGTWVDPLFLVMSELLGVKKILIWFPSPMAIL